MTASGTVPRVGMVSQECRSGIWKKMFKRLVHDFKGCAKDSELVKTSSAVVETANAVSQVGSWQGGAPRAEVAPEP